MPELATSGSASRTFCAQYSIAAGEEMAGTVKAVDLWLLVECRSRWEREAISVFPEAVRERLSSLRTRYPRMRLALIRQPTRNSGPLNIFWAFSRERQPELYRGEFNSYKELSFDAERLPGKIEIKLFAVCTHGAHDLCCAQFGNKIYSEIRTLTENVWHISHIGGCRFAPNVVCLPHGIVYGRMNPGDCASVVSSYQRDNLVIEKLRGRCCYSKPVQAAEQLLRSSKHLTVLDDLVLSAAKEVASGQWLITFATEDSIQYNVLIALESGGVSTYKSCSDSELLPREKFRLLGCS